MWANCFNCAFKWTINSKTKERCNSRIQNEVSWESKQYAGTIRTFAIISFISCSKFLAASTHPARVSTKKANLSRIRNNFVFSPPIFTNILWMHHRYWWFWLRTWDAYRNFFNFSAFSVLNSRWLIVSNYLEIDKSANLQIAIRCEWFERIVVSYFSFPIISKWGSRT